MYIFPITSDKNESNFSTLDYRYSVDSAAYQITLCKHECQCKNPYYVCNHFTSVIGIKYSHLNIFKKNGRRHVIIE